MDLSIIIPTYNRASKICFTLEALLRQTEVEFEVIIVVDGSTDNTIEVVRQFENQFPRFHVEVTSNGGRAKARNAGAGLAVGTYLIFIDDDIQLFPDAACLHRKLINENPNSVIFGALELAKDSRPSDFQEYRSALESDQGRHVPEEITLNQYAFTSANMSIARTTFEGLGGFDPALRDSEDFDFSVRALLNNIGLKYAREIMGYHDDHLSLSQYVTRRKEYLRSKYLLLKIHPEYKNLLPAQFAWMNRRPSVMRQLLFGNSNWWNKRFNSWIFLALPRAVKNRLYSAYIYVHTVLRVQKEMKGYAG